MKEKAIDPDELIREAYAVVAEPERLFDLQMRLARAQQRSQEEARIVGEHLDQVGALFDALHLGPDADFSKVSLVPSEEMDDSNGAEPVLTLDRDFRVIGAAGWVWSGHAPEEREFAPDWLFGPLPETRRRVQRAMREGDDEGVYYFRLFAGPEDIRGFMTMAHFAERDGAVVMEFTGLRLEWQEEAGERFARIMGLSETEAALTARIVSGGSVADFAKERDRSVGTARNQMKAVLRKLGIGSQSELVSLYAGFASSLSLRENTVPRKDRPALGDVARLANGSTINFARYGRAGGRPVILLHGAIEGPFMPAIVEQAAHAAGLEIFVPWMPFYSDIERPSDPKGTVERFLATLDAFCNALRIEQCGLLACSISCAYGFAAAKRLPHRFIGLVAFALPVPMNEVHEIEGVNPLWRAPLLLGKNAPGAVNMLVRAVVKLAMRGEAHIYFDRLFQDSPRDLATLHRPDVAAVVRKAFRERPDKAQRAMAHAVLIQALDWSDWLEDIEIPVRIVIAEEDPVHKVGVQVQFCQRRGFSIVGPVEGLGGFSLFQQPARVFAEVRSLFDD